MPDNNLLPEAPPTPESRRTSTGSLQFPGGWTRHAPPGGISIAGKFYKGGQFIPNEALEAASPEEIENLKQKLAAPGAVAGKKDEFGEAKEKEEQETQPPAEKPAGPKFEHYAYILDTGKLLGQTNGHFGTFILRNSLADEPLLHAYELKLFRSLRTHEVHLVIGWKQLVVQIKVEEGDWPDIGIDEDQNILSELEHYPGCKVISQPLQTYTVLKDLEPTLVDVLLSQPQPTVSPLSSNMRLYRKQKISNTEWELEDNNGAIYKFDMSLNMYDPERRFAEELYRKFNIPQPRLQPYQLDNQIGTLIFPQPASSGESGKTNELLEAILSLLTQQQKIAGSVDFSIFSLQDITNQLKYIADQLTDLNIQNLADISGLSAEQAEAKKVQLKNKLQALANILTVELNKPNLLP